MNSKAQIVLYIDYVLWVCGFALALTYFAIKAWHGFGRTMMSEDQYKNRKDPRKLVTWSKYLLWTAFALFFVVIYLNLNP